MANTPQRNHMVRLGLFFAAIAAVAALPLIVVASEGARLWWIVGALTALAMSAFFLLLAFLQRVAPAIPKEEHEARLATLKLPKDRARDTPEFEREHPAPRTTPIRPRRAA